MRTLRINPQTKRKTFKKNNQTTKMGAKIGEQNKKQIPQMSAEQKFNFCETRSCDSFRLTALQYNCGHSL